MAAASGKTCGDCARFKVPDACCPNLAHLNKHMKERPLMDTKSAACNDFLQARKANASSTEVNYPQSVLSGVRKTVGFKCDTGLYSAFKPVAKAYFGSICHPLECFMLAVLALQKEQVNFGETVRIERLNIERNLRPRRNLPVDVCGFKNCNEPAVAVGIWKNQKKLQLCEKHLREAKNNAEEWRLISNVEGSSHSSE